VLSQREPPDAAVNFDTRIKVDNGAFTYAKHGNIVDSDVSGAKSSTERLESYYV